MRTIKKSIVEIIKEIHYTFPSHTLDSGLRIFRDYNDTRDVEKLLHEHGLVELYVQYGFESNRKGSKSESGANLVNV